VESAGHTSDRIVAIKKVKEQYSERFKQEVEIWVRTPRRRISSLKKDFRFNSRQSRASDFELVRCNAIYVRIPFSLAVRVRL
jgi:hypothetical protein